MKCRIIGDSTNKPRFSTNIIVESLNSALKELDLYGEEVTVKYDALCQTHGDEVDAYVSTYELSFPKTILDNAGGRPILGVSLHNWNNIIDGGYQGQSNYFNLGVDSSFYPVVEKTQNKNQFVFALYSESLSRGGFETVIETFAEEYKHDKNYKLIVKDRNGTSQFRDYVTAIKDFYEVDVEYINEHWDSKEQIIDFAQKFDVYINTNRCSTFNMPVLEMMSMGKPCIITPYSGPADFCLDEFNALCPDFQVRLVDSEIGYTKSIGCRNFLFEFGYTNPPVWASTTKGSLQKKMAISSQDEELTKKIAKNARKTAELMTWRKSALNFHYILDTMTI